MDEMKRPATYFLQEAIDRGLQAIAARLDPEKENRPFFWLNLRPEPCLEHQIWDLGDMCSRYVDAYILGRQVTGNTYHIDAEAALRRLLPDCDPYAHPFMAGRMLLAYVDIYLQEPNVELRRQVDDLVRLIRSRMTFEGDYAYYLKAPENWRSLDQPLGDFAPYPTYPLGGVMLALSRYVESVEAPESEDLLDRLCRFVIHRSGTFEEDGRYRGHTHSGGILTAAAGILRDALRRGDGETIERMKNVFDWTLKHSSGWGWVPDGLGPEPSSCETCSLTDALHIALLLGRSIDPFYFDIAERFARNQLMENQFTRPERAIPEGDFPHRKAVEKALFGSWASWSLPNSLDNNLKGVEGCCLGAGIRGCFLVWDSIIEKREDAVYIHMAFSRNSPWVEVIGYQPYRGRIDVSVHDAPRLRVRIPPWVNEGDLRVSLKDKSLPVRLSGNRYLELDGLQRGDLVHIEYPLRQEEGMEIVAGQEYRVKWQGDSVVLIEPEGRLYPLYRREWMVGDEAPLMPDQPYKTQMGGPVRWYL